jgi:hypothetical protein
MTDPFVEYYLNQAGSGIGPVFRGAMYQRGHGIGSWLSGLFRSVFPLFKSGAKTIGQEALNAGFGLLRDTINQKPLKASLKERMREVGNNLMSKADDRIDAMHGSGYKRRKRPKYAPNKRHCADIFS